MLLHFFVVKFILVSFSFPTMVVIPVKEVKLVIEVDDLDFRIKNVTFGAKVLNSMAPLIELQIGTWNI